MYRSSLRLCLVLASLALPTACASSASDPEGERVEERDDLDEDADDRAPEDSRTTRDAGRTSPRRDASAPADSEGDASSAPPTQSGDVSALRPRCVRKPTQVMVVGDSYINWLSHTLPKDLQRESGQTGWRMEAIGAASMGSGGVTRRIPKQFDVSYARDPDVHTVLMDGGGNDILVPAGKYDPSWKCKNDENAPRVDACQTIVRTALEAGQKLIDRGAEVGVRDVIYFFYPRVPEGTPVGGKHPNAINDYARPMVRDLCEGAASRSGGKVRCHFVDMVPVFEGHPEYFAKNDIHPNPTGSAAMAKAIWSVMKQNCIAQPESSGCCEP